MSRLPTEYEIQRALCLWLDGNPDDKGVPRVWPAIRPDVIYFHTPNGGARSAIEGRRFKQIGVKAGIYDVTFLGDSRFWVLELKDLTGCLSKAQIDMGKRYERAGAAAVGVANCLADAKAFVRRHGLTIPGA